MSTKFFCDFIDRFCALAKIENPHEMYESADLEIDEVKFTLLEASHEDNLGISFYCDFGKVPRNKMRSEILQRLLEVNLGLLGLNSPMFSVNAETEHVLLAGRIEAGKLTPEGLLNSLTQYAAQAREWRKSYYLTAEEQAGMAAKRTAPQNMFMR